MRPPRRFLQSLKLVAVRGADVYPRVSAPRTVFRRNVGAFQVDSSDAPGYVRLLLASASDHGHHAGQSLEAVRGGCRAIAGDSKPIQTPTDLQYIFHGQPRIIECPAVETVHLEVRQTGRDPGQTIVGDSVGDDDVRNPAIILDRDRDRFTCVVPSPHNPHLIHVNHRANASASKRYSERPGAAGARRRSCRESSRWSGEAD